jgi:hypothetical protein
MAKSNVVFHLPKRTLPDYQSKGFLKHFNTYKQVVEENGGTVFVTERIGRLTSKNSDDTTKLDADAVHIIENGNIRQPNALNTTISYLKGYVHLDPNGVLARSSAADCIFPAPHIDEEVARNYWNSLHSRFVVNRKSRYNQPTRRTHVPEGSIAVFLQGDHPHKQGTAFCDSETMLRTVCQYADGRPVVVKAHPQSRVEKDAMMIYELLSEGLELHPTDANVHDVLENCVASVSHNSAVAIEGFLHSKPAILFGKSDFWQICETVSDPIEFPSALARATTQNYDFAGFVHWYFTDFCINLNGPKRDAQILGKLKAAGFGCNS